MSLLLLLVFTQHLAHLFINIHSLGLPVILYQWHFASFWALRIDGLCFSRQPVAWIDINSGINLRQEQWQKHRRKREATSVRSLRESFSILSDQHRSFLPSLLSNRFISNFEKLPNLTKNVRELYHVFLESLCWFYDFQNVIIRVKQWNICKNWRIREANNKFCIKFSISV